ncbi:unnamed protein product [Moneuplotes crassus]|uniref:Cyclic nucleotide-binding domain-containing protein n=1 Tax=Euplotes crassus TaxID=5936 RepID=A0AAD1Y479_EUPCR|nr:unnamed protein product [Moneuplotes crassus]
MVEDLCQVLTLYKMNKGQTVFRLGDYGNIFYIIIHGTVSVHVKVDRDIIEGQNDPKLEENHHKKIMVEVTRLNAPNSFGEIALMEYKPRAATIKCVEDCVFALIDKSNYQKIFGRLQRRIYEKIVKLFRSVPYFTNWSENEIKKLHRYFTEVDCRRNTSIYKQGDIADYVYLVKEGDFDFRRKIIHKLKPKHSFLNIYSEEPDTNMFRSNSPLSYPSGMNRLDPQNFKCAQVGKGSMFGEHEAVKRCIRRTTVICNSTTGKLLRISAKDFVTVIKQISPKTLGLIEKSSEGITDLVNHFLQNKREVEIQSRMEYLGYDDKIKGFTKKISNFPEKQKSKDNLEEEKKVKTISYAQLINDNPSDTKKFNNNSRLASRRKSSRVVKQTLNLDHNQLLRGFSRFSNREASIFDNTNDSQTQSKKSLLNHMAEVDRSEFDTKRSKSPIMIQEDFSQDIGMALRNNRRLSKMPTMKMHDLKTLRPKNKKVNRNKIVINAGVGDLRLNRAKSRNKSKMEMHSTARKPRIISPLSNRVKQISRVRNLISPLSRTKFTRKLNLKSKKIGKILQIRSKMLSRNTKAKARFNSIKRQRKSPFSPSMNFTSAAKDMVFSPVSGEKTIIDINNINNIFL